MYFFDYNERLEKELRGDEPPILLEAEQYRKRSKIVCPVIKEANKKRIKDYEAYDTMHSNDGIIGKSVCSRRL